MKKAASVSALVAASLLSGCVICFNAHPAPSLGARTIVKAVEAGDEATLENALRTNLLALASCVRTALHSAAHASLLAGRYWGCTGGY